MVYKTPNKNQLSQPCAMPQSIRVCIETLGCKLNQAESETLARQLVAEGCCLVSPEEQPDVYVLNTCTVTHIADRKGRHLLAMAKRRNPHVLSVAIGCYAERAEQTLATSLRIDLVLGNDAKLHLPKILRERLVLSEKGEPSLISGRTRAFIKVQDGCDNHCAYCIVPFVRGHAKSVPVGDVLSEVQQRISEGCREVVFTGTELGSYAAEDGLNIKGLLQHILAHTAIERIRVSSLQPHEITPALLALWENERLCQHFHISLQSGADSVLKRMRRGYTTAGYQKTLALINTKLPHAAVTTDVIAGFPGETDAEYQQSMDFCSRTSFARIHVFPYSSRPGTEAANMSEQIPAAVKKERVHRMLELAKEKAHAFHERFIGCNLKVLWEQSQNGIWNGYSSQYIRVYTHSQYDLTNTICSVKLLRIYKDGLWGELNEKPESYIV